MPRKWNYRDVADESMHMGQLEIARLLGITKAGVYQRQKTGIRRLWCPPRDARAMAWKALRWSLR